MWTSFSTAGGFSWRREQWSNIDIETKIRKSGGNYFLSTVVSVLSNLRDQQARSPTLGNFECLNCGAHSFDGAGHADLPLVNPRNRFDFGAMSAENLFHRRRDFSPSRFDAPRLGKCEGCRSRDPVSERMSALRRVPGSRSALSR
jgi:hypothetical protein